MELKDAGEIFEKLITAFENTIKPKEREEIKQQILTLALKVGERAAQLSQ